jgi:translation initiation factor 2 gamma subunit (eIF-2gamma)
MFNDEFEKEVEKRLKEAGIKIGQCRSCKRPIFFMRTKDGKNAPMTLELRNHFIDCPQSNYYKKPKLKK